MRELHSRETNGIHVRLLWCESDGRVAVAVIDTQGCESFLLEVRDGERAMDVFHHPFAYAAFHGVKVSPPRRAVDEEPVEQLAA